MKALLPKAEPKSPDAADALAIARGIEVGHIFYFGTKYSEPMKATVTGPDGKVLASGGGGYGQSAHVQEGYGQRYGQPFGRPAAGQPRSRPIRFIMPRYGWAKAESAAAEVSPTKAWVLMATGRGS